MTDDKGKWLGYDSTDPISIENYGQGLIGLTFEDVCRRDDMLRAIQLRESNGYKAAHEDKKRKGGLGEIIEERYFHYKANNDSRPDFHEAGVELKVTPYKINKNGSLVAKERLVLTMIDYFTVVNEQFENSHMWQKSRLILLVYYLYRQDTVSRLDYRIDYVRLFTPPKQDVAIIRHDFEIIKDKVRAGKAHELSEADTLYLSAAPKASTSKIKRKQPYNEEMAKPRAFAFKNSYMTYVLNSYIVPGKDTYEPIIKGLEEIPFEEYVTNKIDAYSGYTTDELCSEFDFDIRKKPKNLEALLAYRILGIKGNHAEEFEKANVVVKAIRVAKNNKIKESMSFPAFKFKELVEEEWENSTFGNYLRETRFLFVVYKHDNEGKLRLRGCQFWNIPYADLEGNVKEVWEETKQVLMDGIQIEVRNGFSHDNFPKAADNPVSHVRPHARNARDTYELPDGRYYTKQCFWLNNSYILSQINPNLYRD